MPANENPTTSRGAAVPLEKPPYVKGCYDRIVARSEKFTSGSHWRLKAVLLSIIFSVLFSGGLDYRLLSDGPDVSDSNGFSYGYSAGYFKKIENPWVDVGKLYDPGSHDAKLNFRLTVPVVLHYLGLRNHWLLPLLTIAAICATLLISCEIAFRLTQDRVTGLFVSLMVAATFVGSFGYIAYYDSIALAQLALAMLPGLKPFLKGLLVFTACFTDERAFVASAFLLVPPLVLPAAVVGVKRFTRPDFLAVVIGMAGYAAGRLYLMKIVGLSSPMTAVTFELLLRQANFLHLGAWFALEGGWVLVALAVVLMWRRRQWLGISIILLTMFVLLIGSFMVADVLRSASYLFPAVLVALMVLADAENIATMRLYCFIAFVISAVGGNYNIFSNQIVWQKPLLVTIGEEIVRTLFVWL